MPAKENVYDSSVVDHSRMPKIREMKHTKLLIALLFATQWVYGQKVPVQDSFESIERVIIQYFANEKSNIPSFSILNKQNIDIQNHGKDIPQLLQNLPNVVSTSDAGNGIGYTGLRIRGSDGSRTNVSLNGVPINDAERHGTFWVNMPDLASSTSSILVQRGVGTSNFGASAFGATVLIRTESNPWPENEINFSFGSFGTSKFTAKFGTGNKSYKNKVVNFDLRLSNIQSNGYADRSSTNLYGYQSSASVMRNQTSLKLMVFGGWEKTYQAWWGIPIEKYNLAKKPGDSSKLFDHFQRNLGTLYRNKTDSINLFESNSKTYNYYTYPNETDNYQQHHAHLYYKTNIYNKSIVNFTLYYTFGSGYFEQFRLSDSLSKYQIDPIKTSDTTSLYTTNIVSQRWLQNHLIGFNTTWQYEYSKKTQIQTGLGIYRYAGKHFGNVVSYENTNNQIEDFESQKTYYKSTGNKIDINLFSILNHSFNTRLSGFLDMQYRYVYHRGIGNDNDYRTVDFLGDFSFFNPKIGVNYAHKWKEVQFNYHSSISVGSREPSRSDFTDNKTQNIPEPERLIDYELAFKSAYKSNTVKITGYYMDYKNQLVLSGAVNDVGTALRVNVPNSYRTGIELETEFLLLNKVVNSKSIHQLRFIANVSFSQNRIKSTTVTWLDYATYTNVDSTFTETPISYSPNTVAAAGLHYTFRFSHFDQTKPSKTLTVAWMQKYVSRQYLDNTGDETRSIPHYHVGELNIMFQPNPKISVKLQVQNILNSRYLNNAYTWGYFYGNRNLVQEVFVFPTAPTSIMVGVSYKF